MGDAELGGTLRLGVGQLAVVVVETLRTVAVKARPERGLGDSDAAGHRHALVVVGRSADHVDVRVDVFHAGICGVHVSRRACPADGGAAVCRAAGQARRLTLFLVVRAVGTLHRGLVYRRFGRIAEEFEDALGTVAFLVNE